VIKAAVRVQHNCFEIYKHALHFHESDHRLRNTVKAPSAELALIAHPSMVLSVFATELYFKTLLCLEAGKVPKTHNLKSLFDGLLPETRKALEELWATEIKKPHSDA
jgi:HEPN domain-containing protein